MTRLSNVQRLRIEDFEEEDRELVAKFAEIFNYFMTQTVDTVNGRLDYDNINRELITIDVTLDGSGNSINPITFRTETGNTIRGIVVLSAQNLTNRAVFPNASPFISFEPTGNSLYKVNKITGLPASNRFQLLCEVIY